MRCDYEVWKWWQNNRRNDLRINEKQQLMKKVKEVVLYFGSNSVDEKETTLNEFLDFCRENINPILPNLTIYEGKAFWNNILENCFVVTSIIDSLVFLPTDFFKTIGKEYCVKYNQECILMTIKDINSALIGRE